MATQGSGGSRQTSNTDVSTFSQQSVGSGRVALAVLFALLTPIIGYSVEAYFDYSHAATSVESAPLAGLGIEYLKATFLFIALFSPLLYGYLLSLAWRGKSLEWYIFFSVVMLIFGFILQIFIDALLQFWQNGRPLADYAKNIIWSYAFVKFSFIPASMFLSGLLLGDFAETTRHRSQSGEPKTTIRQKASQLTLRSLPSFAAVLLPMLPAIVEIIKAVYT